VLYEDFVQKRKIHEHRIPAPLRVATLEADEVVKYRITNELTSMTPYDIPMQYAVVIDGAVRSGRRCFDGIKFRSRFDPRPEPRALALFGEEGEKDWVSCTPSLKGLIDWLQKCAGVHIEVADIPTTDEMR
jgi:hypothetical protein